LILTSILCKLNVKSRYVNRSVRASFKRR